MVDVAEPERGVQDLGQNPFIYGYGARPIQQPKGSEAGKIMGQTIGSGLKEAGSLLDEGTKLAFNVEKQHIQEDMTPKYDAIQNDWISRLASVDDVLKRSKDPEGLINNYSGKYPADIQKLPGAVDQLIALRDNGKVPQTYLDMQKDNLAKSLRAKYGPGMREVVDGEFSRLTRQDPANKVIAQMTDDINAAAASAKERRGKVENQILSAVGKGIVPFSAYQQAIKNPAAVPGIMEKVYAHAKAHLDLVDDDLRIRNEQANRTLTKEKVTDNNDTNLDRLAGIAASNFELDVPGMGKQHIDGVLNSLDKMDDATRLQVGQAFRAAGLNVATQMRNWGMKPIDPNDPKSPSRASFDPNFEKKIEEKRKYFEDMAEYILKDKVGLAYSTNQWIQAAVSSKSAEAIKNIPGLAAMVGLEKIAGPNSQYVNKFFQNYIQDKTVQEQMQPYVSGSVATAVVQPNLQQTGMPFTLGNALDDATRKQIDGPSVGAIMSGAKWVLNNPESPMELRQNAATFLYGDSSALTRVNDSKVTNGNVGGGKSTVLANLVNDQNTAAVKKLGNPEATQKYIEFAKKSTWLTIHPEIEQLSKTAENPQIEIGWDSKLNQWYARPNLTPEQRRAGIRAPQEFGAVQDSITKINLALRSMISVSTKLTHEPVQDFLAQFFVESGMDPKQIQNTIGGQFINALINANKPKVEEIAN